MRLDALIFGSGAEALWLLDRMSRMGHHVVLLESEALGTGETIQAQGMIASGSLASFKDSSGRAVRVLREVARTWHDAFLGRSAPNLSETRLRAGGCYLWTAPRTKFGRELPAECDLIAPGERPPALAGCSGSVAAIPQQVLATESFVQDLYRQYHDRILWIDSVDGLEFVLESPGEVRGVRLTSPETDEQLTLQPRQVIFTAGPENGELRRRVGLGSDVMSLHAVPVVLARGALPELNGTWCDDDGVRLTVTSDLDSQERQVWQIQSHLAQFKELLDSFTLVELIQSELKSALPGIDLTAVEWSSYTVQRAASAVRSDPHEPPLQVLCAGNVTTGWTSQFDFAPLLAQEIASRVSSPYHTALFDTSALAHWPRPRIAQLPWNEFSRQWWNRTSSRSTGRRRAA